MDSVETQEDFGSGKDATVRRWLEELRLAGKEQEKWEERADKVLDRYRDERGAADDSNKLNILWSNVETLKPALYARMPKPQVSRRFKDRDPVGRQAAMVLERALEYHLDAYDLDDVITAGREDYLLPGRAVARVMYEPTFGPPEPLYQEEVDADELGMGEEQGEPEEYRPLVYEEAQCKYVYWKDFRHGAARRWSGVPWVAFREYLTREQLVSRFGEKIGNAVPLDYTPDGVEESDELPKDLFQKAVVWEIWDKTSGKCLWVAESYKDAPLDESEPPLAMSGFFPCGKPLLSVSTNDSLVPIPEYCEYQDQAEELDNLTARIDKLTDALRVVGVYAAEAESIKRMLQEGTENDMIPVENWAMFAEKGGMKGIIDWFPVEQVAKVLLSLFDARERVKQDLYEITGLSDIIRGSSKASETATAQRIKGQFASLRLQDRQRSFANWVRDLLRLKAEVIAEHFSAETLAMMTGLEVTPEVMQVLRNDALRSFKIDIETDSTIQPDEQADKDSRVEFLTAASGFMERMLPVVEKAPAIAPLAAEMLMFGVRGFRAGRELEDAFEQAMQAIQEQVSQPEQPDPESIKTQAEAEKIKAETQQTQVETAQTQVETAQTQVETAQTQVETQLSVVESEREGMVDYAGL